ncbi:type VI secretion system baseplate subunit TssF [Parachitinimonas caeni]|uniref:Type VI secretion system baseplate subunit TssF n=1 Tax=Parachitinimonas caeni TaxID=3031301 RepID=A0ABT7E2L0_9NEIS|nr:type VI secretion system baseplate subunit TssF [Parachitinimonas caeni]MDK2126558.1 type VI secretion system baseplate subunit TssF [Parachitinimonas caeni]
MNSRFLELYNQELRHVREMGVEFAAEYPKIARRLGLGGVEVEDPYVERLLEGFGFLSARVHLKLEAEFPQFTRHLLEMIYPHYGNPTPAVAIAQMVPSQGASNLANGYTVPRGSRMRGLLTHGEQTACEFVSAHEIKLWPIELESARYQTYAADLPPGRWGNTPIKGLLRLRLRTRGALRFDQLQIDDLPIFLAGPEDVASRLHELILGNAAGLMVSDPNRPGEGARVLPASCVQPVGFEDNEALLPYGNRSFQGYRLLHEYFAMPHRYLFFRLAGLADEIRRVGGDQIEIVLPFTKGDDALASLVDGDAFKLFCTPVVNLFRKRIDRIHLQPGVFEHHVVVDRRRPQDFEVFQLLQLEGYTANQHDEQIFRPFYASYDAPPELRGEAYFTVRREARLLSDRQRRTGARASYAGSELFVSLVDRQQAPFRADLDQLGGEVLATNRDLPLMLPTGGDHDFTLLDTAPVDAVRCLRGPSRPLAAVTEGEIAWRFISHLSLNYLSLTDLDPQQGAAALRELLSLYSERGDIVYAKQLEGIRSVSAKPVTRRLPMPGPIVFGRGIEVQVLVDETPFAGSSPFLLGMVLERFFARHVSLNSFSQTVLTSQTRGELKRWSARAGTRQIV